MSEIRADKIWCDGHFLDWDKAQVHVISHALHYGTSWFEGIRCYKTRRGPEVFRLPEHLSRLYDSCRIYPTEVPYPFPELQEAVLETIRRNRLEQCYIRPLIMKGTGAIGVSPVKAVTSVYVIVWEWGAYLGGEAINKGVDACISTWNRAAPNTFPSMAKAGGNYLNSGLVKMEAEVNGYSEGIALDVQGLVSEGSGANLFLVRGDIVYTPKLENAILPGITRDSVIVLARELGYKVEERAIPREMLYLADEMFFAGTAAEVTPIRSLDKVSIGSGRVGPVTAKIQNAFFEIVQGRVADRFSWMTPVKQYSRA